MNTGFSRLSKGTLYSVLSPYERVVLGTPGLAMWWPLHAKVQETVTGPVIGYNNAAGAGDLQPQGSGADTIVPGIVPGSRNTAVKLSGGRYLRDGDYKVLPAGWETVMSVEWWMRMDALAQDVAFLGEFDSSSNGWLCYSDKGSGTRGNSLYMYCAGNRIGADNLFTAGQTYHVVCVYGGCDLTDGGDYLSRGYVNGVEVFNGSLVTDGVHDTIATSVFFTVGQYKNGAASNSFAGTMQHVAIYYRMLQPLEVKQHYEAGFARG